MEMRVIFFYFAKKNSMQQTWYISLICGFERTCLSENKSAMMTTFPQTTRKLMQDLFRPNVQTPLDLFTSYGKILSLL